MTDGQNGLPDYNRECFFITPIGKEESEERQRLDNIWVLVKRVCKRLELTPISALDVERSGHVSRQVIEHLTKARVAIADLTLSNPNVLYEIAIRHTANLPVILLARIGTTPPFDVNQERTVIFDESKPVEVERAVDRLVTQTRAALDGDFESPVVSAVRLADYRTGSETNTLLVELIDSVADISSEVDSLHKKLDSSSLNTDWSTRFITPRTHAHTLGIDVLGSSARGFTEGLSPTHSHDTPADVQQVPGFGMVVIPPGYRLVSNEKPKSTKKKPKKGSADL